MHAWWLVPAEPWRGRLQQEIERLAAQTGGPVFEPHLTLAVGSLPEGLDWDVLGRRLQARLRAITLRAGARGQTPQYFQTLFIRMGGAPEVLAALDAQRNALVAELEAAVQQVGEDGEIARAGRTGAPAFEPHLSLCYAQLSLQRRQALAALPCIAGETLRFDTLVGVRPRAGADGLGRVADWDDFLRISLA